jgi:hypothetical protein
MQEVVNYEHWKSFFHHDEMKKIKGFFNAILPSSFVD